MKVSGLQSPVPSKNPLGLRATASDNDGSSSNGGHTRPMDDRFSGGRCFPSRSASNMSSASTRLDTSGQFASTTPSSHTPKGHNPSDDIYDASDTSPEQCDPSSGTERMSSLMLPFNPIASPRVPSAPQPCQTPWAGATPDHMAQFVGQTEMYRITRNPSLTP
ncbi:hypothetical protein BS47DRAFT_1102442 [Hydnum rufescens UP504]|uniref:Uncharacterized protein n=1 Tax=Hydnum rufescens UP504 TaxID=1448309 RepID=A0A9P6AUZ9_9AGAM|nr:hypothetical protein BS47DRAFT_1102442 [Hydnum rufescens UP504]